MPPQAQPQVAAIQAAVQASVGNANGFATAVMNAKDVGRVLTVAIAFSDLIANQHAETLLRLSASASAFGYNNIANYVNEAFGRAVSDQVSPSFASKMLTVFHRLISK